ARTRASTGVRVLPARGAFGWSTWKDACAVALLVACMLASAACSDSSGPSAATLLAQAQTAFSQLTSFHFTLAAQHLGGNDPLPITQATGDVRRPDQLSVTASVVSALGPVQVKLIILGSQEWITDPLTGAFQPTTNYAGFLANFDAQQGVGATLTQLRNASTPQSSSAAAGACWKISGTLPASAVAGVVNGAAGSNASVPTSICIGKSDSELYSISLAGAVSQSDPAQTSRTFALTRFNQPVTITAPVPTPTT
ncbi:MAG TPA: LppX_LprAFG lipoprotein, partial [Ktedonobacterales bacterium]